MAKEKRYKILVVDDAPQNLYVIIETLKDEYSVVAVTNGEKALEIANKDPIPDLMLLDIKMEGMDGFEVLNKIRSTEKTKDMIVIFVTAMHETMDETIGLSKGANDYITKPIRPGILKSRLKTHLELMESRKRPDNMFYTDNADLKLLQTVMIETIALIADYRDPETGGHLIRTQKYVQIILLNLQKQKKYKNIITKEYIDKCYIAAPLHDLGKVAVFDNILRKPGKLTDEEYEIIKSHSIVGYNILKRIEIKLKGSSYMKTAYEIALSHHEKWDGSGYPLALKGDEIPLSGQIMALADVYDALISKRVYKESFLHSDVVNIIIEEREKHFAPDIVDAFLEVEKEFQDIAQNYNDFKHSLLEIDDHDIL